MLVQEMNRAGTASVPVAAANIVRAQLGGAANGLNSQASVPLQRD
jgi:hypothetical protein